MPHLVRLVAALAFLTVAVALSQIPDEPTPRLKRSQLEAILKEDHKRSLADAAQLVKLAEELQLELEKSDRHVLSIAAIKRTEEIEKLAKRIRSRMRRF